MADAVTNGGPAVDDGLDMIARLIHERAGLLYEDARRPLLASRVRELMVATGIPSMADLACRLMKIEEETALWDNLISRIITRESSWFRQGEHFTVLHDFVLPAVYSSKAFEQDAVVRILSAGCSQGQEAYSLAIMVEEFKEHSEGVRAVIEGCDIDAETVNFAREGVYSEPELRGLTPAHRAAHFERVGSRWRVAPHIRNAVRFFRHNLLEPLQTQPYDIIFCRNVTIYFDRETTKRVVRNLAEVLNPGGHLFSGHAEIWREPNPALKPIQFGETVIHRRARGARWAEGKP
ncbi:N/A [soil metagenome]